MNELFDIWIESILINETKSEEVKDDITQCSFKNYQMFDPSADEDAWYDKLKLKLTTMGLIPNFDFTLLPNINFTILLVEQFNKLWITYFMTNTFYKLHIKPVILQFMNKFGGHERCIVHTDNVCYIKIHYTKGSDSVKLFMYNNFMSELNKVCDKQHVKLLCKTTHENSFEYFDILMKAYSMNIKNIPESALTGEFKKYLRYSF